MNVVKDRKRQASKDSSRRADGEHPTGVKRKSSDAIHSEPHHPKSKDEPRASKRRKRQPTKHGSWRGAFSGTPDF